MIKNVACLNSLYSYLPTHIKFLTEFHCIFFGIMAQKMGWRFLVATP